MGKCHALAWNAVAPVFGDVARPRLVILGEATQDLADRKAREFGFARATGDWREVVGDPAVDVVSITTPNAVPSGDGDHGARGRQACLVREADGATLADAERMLAAARGLRQGRGARLQLHPEPDDPSIGSSSRKGRSARSTMSASRWTRISWPIPRRCSIWKHEATSGYGALDDFAVHPLSLVFKLFGGVALHVRHGEALADPPVAGGRARGRDLRHRDVPDAAGERRVRLIAVNRSAWGRKGRIAVQIFGAKGSIVFDQER